MSRALVGSIREGQGIGSDQWKQLVDLTKRYKKHHSILAGRPMEVDVCLKKLYFRDGEKDTSWRARRKVIFPSIGERMDKVITAVYAYDHCSDDTGGFVHILDGGVGFRHVDLEIVSQVGQISEFTICIFGRYG